MQCTTNSYLQSQNIQITIDLLHSYEQLLESLSIFSVCQCLSIQLSIIKFTSSSLLLDSGFVPAWKSPNVIFHRDRRQQSASRRNHACAKMLSRYCVRSNWIILVRWLFIRSATKEHLLSCNGQCLRRKDAAYYSWALETTALRRRDKQLWDATSFHRFNIALYIILLWGLIRKK